jgi:hypothetical protein
LLREQGDTELDEADRICAVLEARAIKRGAAVKVLLASNLCPAGISPEGEDGEKNVDYPDAKEFAPQA